MGAIWKIILLDFTSFWFQSKYANHISQILGTSEGKSKTKTAKNLKKVQRALKTLGVNFLHFDDQTAENDSAKSGEGVNSASSCDKEYCRMGCVCDSVTGKGPSTKDVRIFFPIFDAKVVLSGLFKRIGLFDI